MNCLIRVKECFFFHFVRNRSLVQKYVRWKIINFNTWHRLAVESHAQAVHSSFLWLEVNAELCVTLALYIIWHILAVNRDYYLEVTGTCLTGVNCKKKKSQN